MLKLRREKSFCFLFTEFSPAPRIKIVVDESVENNFDTSKSGKNETVDSDSDEVLSSSKDKDVQSSSGTAEAIGLKGSTSEAVLVSKVAESVVKRRVKRKKRNGARQAYTGVENERGDHCDSLGCDLCDYEKRYSQMSLMAPSDEFAMLKEYLQTTGGQFS